MNKIKFLTAIILAFSFFGINTNAFADSVFELDLSAYQGRDISQVLNEALRDNKSVRISKGSYNIATSILMNADNILDLNGSTLSHQVGAEWAILKNNGFNKVSAKGYEGFGFTLKNGIINLNSRAGLAIGHAPYALIDGITFQNINGDGTHAIEISGSKNVVISNNIFENQIVKEENAKKQFKEIIQVEYSAPVAFPYFGEYDNTPSVNTIIENNTFRSFDIAIGNHYSIAGKKVQNTTIRNNTFENLLYSGSMVARLQGFDGVVFENNNYGNAKLYENVLEGGKESSLNISIKKTETKPIVNTPAVASDISASQKDNAIKAPNTGFSKKLNGWIFATVGGIFALILLAGLKNRKTSVKF